MRDAVIVSAARTPIGRAKKGSLRNTRPEDFASQMLRGLMERTPGLDPSVIDDVIFGCAMPEGEQGMNVTRLITLAAGFPVEVPGITINRFCSSGSQSIAMAADTIKAGNHDVIIAGGVESMSMVGMSGNKPIAYPGLMDARPESYMAMGTTAEVVARRYKISREAQDEFALRSHQRATEAIRQGRFEGQIVPLQVRARENGGWREFTFETDEGPRADTSLAALAKLRPAFDPRGTVTAGNAAQMNDGAGAVVVMGADKAKELGLEPIAFVRQWSVAGVEPDEMGIGPVKSMPKLLKKSGLSLEDIDIIELNEAFASQAVYIINELGLDPEKVNVNGGAIATGHPLGATGAILTVKILSELKRRGGRYGIVTMCIGGGQGFSYLLEMA